MKCGKRRETEQRTGLGERRKQGRGGGGRAEEGLAQFLDRCKAGLQVPVLLRLTWQSVRLSGRPCVRAVYRKGTKGSRTEARG